MANSAKRKGDRAELEVQGILRDLLGVPARRALGAGRKDDVGDITGVPDTVIQVVDYAPKYLANALREKPLECEEQREQSVDLAHYYANDRRDSYRPYQFAATFVRLRGGDYRVVMTPEQFATLWREAQ